MKVNAAVRRRSVESAEPTGRGVLPRTDPSIRREPVAAVHWAGRGTSRAPRDAARGSARTPSDRSSSPSAESQRAAGKGVGEHLEAVPQHEQRAVHQRRRHVPHLHPALGAPAQELDVLGRQVLAAHHRRRPVVMATRRRPRSGRASRSRAVIGVPRIGRRMLDVRPVDVACARTRGWRRSSSACRRGCRRSARRPRTCRGACRCSIAAMLALPTVRPPSRCAFFAARLQERPDRRRARSRCRGRRSGTRRASSAAPASRRAARCGAVMACTM